MCNNMGRQIICDWRGVAGEGEPGESGVGGPSGRARPVEGERKRGGDSGILLGGTEAIQVSDQAMQ